MNIQSVLKTLGPGILFASTAIGVSHLVQSTQAGSKFGYGLLWAVVLANLFKYPFFEFGSRYANKTGKSIIDGYYQLSKFAFYMYLAITAVSMFLVSSAVLAVTAGFMENLFGIDAAIGQRNVTLTLLIFICAGILLIGEYKILDKLIKVIGVTLLITTLLALIFAAVKFGFQDKTLFPSGILSKKENIPFLFALMGWMPTAVDLSAWNSLWTVERIKETGYQPTLKETLFDFNFGYIVSALLAVVFLSLGTLLVYETGQEIPGQAVPFADFVVNIYTKSIGDWSYLLIAVSSFCIMFGTAIAVFDGYARAVKRSSEILVEKQGKKISTHLMYRLSLLVLVIGTFAVILYFQNDPEGFGNLIKVATITSFLIAPIIAIFNFILVQKKFMGKGGNPPVWLNILAIFGIIFLFGFSVFYVVFLLG
ncbi:MAG: divalent metal cation transporter [Crocinitomicaceae bacterium]|nr:divalent metal cation transporter [Crocinitomicaceae bacterium]